MRQLSFFRLSICTLVIAGLTACNGGGDSTETTTSSPANSSTYNNAQFIYSKHEVN
jgi:hypothetical protein